MISILFFCISFPLSPFTSNVQGAPYNDNIAGKLQIEGARLQLKGDIRGAIDKYRESLAAKPNPQLEDLVKRLEKSLKHTEEKVGTSGSSATPEGWKVSEMTFPLTNSSIEDTCRTGSVLFAVTSEEIFRFQDNKWERLAIPEIVGGAFLKSIDCISGNNIYAAGKHVIHFDGMEWKRVDIPGDSPSVWSTIWHTHDGSLILAGGKFVIIKDARGWRSVETGLHAGDYVNALYGESVNDFFAAGGFSGSKGFILHCNRTKCETVKKTDWINDLYGVSGNDIFAVSRNAIFHYDGNAWSTQANKAFDLRKIGSYGGKIVVAGIHGTVMEYKDGKWSSLECPYDIIIESMWQTPDNIIHFSGLEPAVAGHMIVSFDGHKWQTDNPMFNDAMVFADDTAIVVGNGGTIKKYVNGKWTTMQSNTSKNLAALWGTGSSDIYAVGQEGTLIHFNGTNWEKEEVSISGPNLLSIWGSGKDDIYILGERNEIYHFDGSSWVYQNPDPEYNDQFFCLSGSSASNIYAAGTALYHFDGQKWQAIPLPKTQNGLVTFSAIDVTADGEAVLVNGAKLYIFNGSSWTTIEYALKDQSKTMHITDVWGKSLENLYITGYESNRSHPEEVDGVVARYDGQQWYEISRFPARIPLGLAGIDKKAKVVAGENGLTAVSGL